MATKAPRDQHQIFREYLDAVGLHGMAGAEAAGLAPIEWYAVSLITLAGQMSSGDLAARVGLTTGATTRLIDRLEKAGYLRRTADPADRRRVIVEASAETFPDIEDVVGPARRLIAEVLDRYTAEQREVLFDYFAHATPAYRAAAEEIRARAARGRRPGPKPKEATAPPTPSAST
ncbi:MarR family winged helix-turn-helix transcriptional regulator [Nocardia fluminea]|uniref:MarR family winged helix-turn-helix transcriptional regulator n=1 Tax=Nocardia TaxID=1817 RepID=UPI00265B617D|nr:MarR family transcriptional regulator [Nocardia sp. PE-7]WKG08821.1 MarR family transcriptional regulator [Nocardia sp. PE-7]